jgi:PKHD-type hydroxylase
MFLEIPALLNDPEIARLRQLSQELTFVDGRQSNPANIQKHNLQAAGEPGDPRSAESAQIVGAALMRSEQFRGFVFPKRMAPPLLARYEPGMKYGPHADAARVHSAIGTLRSDVSVTVFLQDPASYQGGELVVHLGTRPVAFKGRPGEAILYPSTLLHEVRPVTAGQRLVAITFVESFIADEWRRTQLYELNEVAALEGLKMSWESRIRLEVVRQNLERLWSDS